MKLPGKAQITWVAAGVEISADRQRTWVALAGASRSTRRVIVDMQDPLDGTGVTAARVAMWEALELQHLALDPRSASSTLVQPLQNEGMPLKLADTAAVATAHGQFIDLMNANRLRLRGNTAIDEAVRAAEARKLAGGQAVDRYSGTDMAPLMAAQLGCWALGDPDDAEGIDPGAWVL